MRIRVAELDGRLLDGTVDQGSEARYWLLKFDVAGNADRDGVDSPGMTKVEYTKRKRLSTCGPRDEVQADLVGFVAELLRRLR